MRDEQRLLEEVDATRARLDAYRPYTPDVEQKIRAWFTPRYLFCSSSLGSKKALSGTEIASFLEREIVSGGHPLEAFLAIRRHKEALELVSRHAREGQALTLDFVRQVHRTLTEGTQGALAQPGAWKREASPTTRRRGHEFRFASPSQVEPMMRRLLEEYPEQVKTTHPVKAVTWFYFHFNAIHPFQRDNGKVARLLATCLLTHHGYPPLLIRPDDLGDYLDALSAVDSTVPGDAHEPLSPRFDVTALLRFFCTGLIRTGERMVEIASGRRLSAEEFSEEVSGAQERILGQLMARKTSSWRVQATFQVKALFERVRAVVEQFAVQGPLYSIEVESAEVVPTHAVSPQLRVGLPSSDAGLVGEVSLVIRGDPLMAKAIEFPPNQTLRLGVTATAVGLQLVLCWNDLQPSLNHGPAHASEWPDTTLDELLTASIDKRRQVFEGILRERNASPTQTLRVRREGIPVDPGPASRASERPSGRLPATSSRRNQQRLDGVKPSEPPLSF